MLPHPACECCRDDIQRVPEAIFRQSAEHLHLAAYCGVLCNVFCRLGILRPMHHLLLVAEMPINVVAEFGDFGSEPEDIGLAESPHALECFKQVCVLFIDDLVSEVPRQNPHRAHVIFVQFCPSYSHGALEPGVLQQA